jgi:hypothetical protein
MKVVVATERRVPMEPPIALERPVKKELEKGDYLTYKLRNDPTDAESPGRWGKSRFSSLPLFYYGHRDFGVYPFFFMN